MPLTLEEARWHIASALLHPQLSVSARTCGRREALASLMMGSKKSPDIIREYIKESNVQNEIEFWEGFLDVIEMNLDDIKALRGE